MVASLISPYTWGIENFPGVRKDQVRTKYTTSKPTLSTIKMFINSNNN